MTNLFLTVLDMSITASYVILAILIMRLLLKKAPKKYSYALWAVAGFRLVCPVSFQSVLSLFNLNLFDTAATAGSDPVSIPENIGLAATPQINVGISSLNTVVNEQLPAATPTASVNPLQIWIFVGTVLWLAGIAVMVIVSIINYLRLRHRLRFATRAEKGIWQCETVRSPFILGIVSPTIYLPYGLDDQTLDYILAHEKHHLKRLDHVVKLLSFAVLTVHWFNPLCHLAFYLMNRDMEMSCDEYVLSRNGISSTDYSQTLLSIATNKRFPAPSPLAFGETGVKQRIKNILHWKKPALWVTVTAIVLTVALLVICATDPKKAADSLPTPLGQVYQTQTTIYESPQYSTSMTGASLQFSISDGGTLTHQAGNENIAIGQLESAESLKGNRQFDTLFRSSGWKEDHSASKLRRNNSAVWVCTKRVNMVSTDVYALLQQQDGSLYLLCGVYKENEPMFRLYRLQPPTVTNTSSFDEITADSTDRGTIQWTYDRTGSDIADYYFLLEFNMPYSYIEATCTFGNLIDFDSSSNEIIIPTGRTVTFPAQHTVYWEPPSGSASGNISFKIYGEERLLYYGTISLSGTAENGGSEKVQYTATLRQGTNLMLQDYTQGGAYIYPSTMPPQNNSDDAFISHVLISHYPHKAPAGDLSTCSHQLYFTSASTFAGNEKIVCYSAIAMYRQFTRSNGGVTVTKTDVFPAYIIAHQDANGIMTLIDCGFSDDDIPTAEDQTPTPIHSFDTKEEKVLLQLTQRCYANAAPWIPDVNAVIEDLLNQICASPAQSSSPGPYIEAHQEEYDTLLYYGEYTLAYCFQQFIRGGGAGLSGHIMALACQDTMAALGEDFTCQFGNGNEWFNQFKTHALELRDQGVDLSMYPASHLLLSILPEPIA